MASTIDDVIDRLDAIVERAKREEDRAGFFPALYRKVTLRVKEGIEAGRFDDGPRMERLDVIFANRYLEARARHLEQQPLSSCWQLAFEASQRWSPVVLQHLLLGINAHINLDLGVAAAETVPASDLAAFQPDFFRINDILNTLMDEVQRELVAVWPWMGLIDFFALKGDEWLARFGIGTTRDQAWAVARTLAATPESERQAAIAELDGRVARFGHMVLQPPSLNLRLFLLLVRLGERKSVKDIIEILQ